MSDDKIRAIRGSVVLNPDKQQFMDTIAQAYDKLSEDNGPPVAVVFAFVTKEGGGQSGYYSLPDVSEMNTLFIARASQIIMLDQRFWAGGCVHD